MTCTCDSNEAIEKKISGLFWRLCAECGTTLGEVTGWANQSGSSDPNRNLVIENVHGPTYIANDSHFGGMPSIDFSSGNLSMPGPWSDAPVSQPFTIFIVGRDSASGHPPWIGDADINQWYMATCPLEPDLTGPPHFVSSAVNPSPNDIDVQSTTIDTGQAVVWAYEFSDPNSCTMRINSQLPETLIQRGGTGGADSGIPTLGRLAIGWCFGSPFAPPPVLAEIIVVDGILSDALRASAISYLGARYQIAISGTPGAPMFDPSGLPGLRAWWRADKGVTARVSHWADQSGTGDPNRDVVQSIEAKQPRRVPSDSKLNGKASLHFDSEFLDMVGLWNDAPIHPPYTLVVVGYDGNSATQNFIGQMSANNWYLTAYAGTYAASVGATLEGTTPDSTSAKILVFEYADPVSTIRISEVTPEKIGSIGGGDLPELEVGACLSGQAPLHGAIPKILGYKKKLSALELSALLFDLGNTYGIAIGP